MMKMNRIFRDPFSLEIGNVRRRNRAGKKCRKDKGKNEGSFHTSISLGEARAMTSHFHDYSPFGVFNRTQYRFAAIDLCV